MLAPKKINPKKLAINFFIIAVMLSGTGFLIYKNHQLTSKNEAPFVDMPAAEIEEPSSLQSDALVSNSDGGGGATTTATSSAPVKINKDLDTSVLSSEKFKALKDNSVTDAKNIETGRRNPFEPY